MRRAGAGLLVALWLGGCGAPGSAPTPAGADVQVLRGEALGTTWSVKWLGPPSEDLRPAVDAALAQVDAAMSTWRDDSELARVRLGPGPVPVSEETALVVREALAIAEVTGGAFDPTVEPLMELWGFHGAPRQEAPTDAEVEAARAQVGWDRVRLGRDSEGRATVDAGGTALDLSAIAKGHAVDRVSWALSRLGIADHLVEVGGEVRASGRGPEGAWRLGVDWPEVGSAPGARLAAVVQPVNAGMATSGNYRNTYELDGKRVVHTMDPRTGRPAIGAVLSATVVAPDCRTADGWATALMVLGPDAGVRLIEARPDLDALLLVVADDGAPFQVVQTSGMAAWLPGEPPR